jgi:3-hydroxyisobutyrate dehydrogenase-like beta-hydroxyacid dehydrogenase
METVGFIGLGNMGGPVAGHIQRAGYPMIVYDLRAQRCGRFWIAGLSQPGPQRS